MNQAQHGGTHPDEDADRLQREAALRAEIAALNVYLADQRDNPYATDFVVDRLADYLHDLEEDLAWIDDEYVG